MSPAKVTETRQFCWECQRRRLECDSIRPCCNKCRTSGIVCPGYEDKKPLVWLAPGKVKSRTRRKKAVPPSTSDSQPSVSGNAARASLETKRPGTKPQTQGDSLRIMLASGLRTKEWDVVEATSYWVCLIADNIEVLPTLLASQLAANPFVGRLEAMYDVLPSTTHALVAIAVVHRILRVPPDSRNQVTALWPRAQEHRGVAIRSLNDEIGKEVTRGSDSNIASVMIFMYAELQISRRVNRNWRYHVEGLFHLLALQGSLKDFLDGSPVLRAPFLFLCLIYVILGNTVCHPSKYVTVVSDDEMAAIIPELVTIGYCPFFSCPMPLLQDMIRINRLRFQAVNTVGTDTFDRAEAERVLEDILAFSPEAWAETNESFRGDWRLIGQTYQSALVVYCIASFQSIGALPPTPELTALRAAHSNLLSLFVEKAVASPRIKMSVLWPLVVAGMAAAEGSAATRATVAKQLSDMGSYLGSSAPLAAKAALEAFWASGKTGWDDCFDEPYVFVN